MHNDIAIFAGIISVMAALPYILDTIKGKTHPNVVSWFTWTLINVINTAAAFSSGAIQTGIFTAAAGIASRINTTRRLKVGLKTLHPVRCDLPSDGFMRHRPVEGDR
jgi:hypothetical protein